MVSNESSQIAVIKTLPVARNCMHLKHEKALIYALALLADVFVVVLLFGLLPGCVYHPDKR